MKCSQIQKDLAVYADGLLTDAEAAAVAAHLDSCPVCRGVNAELVEMRVMMGKIRRPDSPPYLQNRIKAAALRERKAVKRSWLPFPADIREWITHAVMPYSVGAVASVVIGISLLTVLNSSAGRYTQFNYPSESGFILAQDRDPWAEAAVDGVSPAAFARSRSDVSADSPSINPKGALIALSRSMLRGEMKDDEVVVVADVFSDGLAQIAQVVEPSRDHKTIDELKKAFDTESLAAPFVPAKLEGRPDSMRVVLRFQSVNVQTGLRKAQKLRS